MDTGVRAVCLLSLAVRLGAEPQAGSCPPPPWTVTESTDTEVVVLLEAQRHHLRGHTPEVPVPRGMLRPGRWRAPGGPSAPSEVTVVGDGRFSPASLDAVEWLCVDPCEAGIPVCAWTARYHTLARGFEGLAVVPGRVAVKPAPAVGPERSLTLVDETLPVEHRVPRDCQASDVGPFELVTCREANAAYLRAGGRVVASAWEDYGEASLRVLGLLDDETVDAWLVRTSAKFEFSSSWLCRRGQEWQRSAGDSGRLGGGICDGDPEIAVLNPATGRADPRPGEGGRPFWYAVVDTGRDVEVAWVDYDGQAVDEKEPSGRVLFLARGLPDLSESRLVTAAFSPGCEGLAGGAAWGAERRSCRLAYHGARFGEQVFELSLAETGVPYALGATGLPQLTLSVEGPGPIGPWRHTLFTAPPELMARLRVLFAGDIDGDQSLDLVLQAPRPERPEQDRVRLFSSSSVPYGERLHENAIYDVPLAGGDR